ncbi:MAG: hypothetical protein K2N34_01275 [Lachnospiraceae bacterium]|nr:hypothetical protein [Lachnospiraceae bacterium]
MVINIEDNYFDYVKNNPDRKIIVYGMGNVARNNYKDIGHIDFFCDQRAKSIEAIEDIPCLLPEELAGIHESMVILVCVRTRELAEQICMELNKLQIDAEIFYFLRNPAFSCLLPYSELLSLAAVIRDKIVEKGHCSIVDIGGDGKNYISLAGGFGNKCIEYHRANVYSRENKEDRLEHVNEEAIGLLSRADICILDLPHGFSSYSDLLVEITESGIEYIFIKRYIPKTIMEHQKLNRNMYDLGYDICLDLFQSGRSAEVWNGSEGDDRFEYRRMLYQTRKSRHLLMGDKNGSI